MEADQGTNETYAIPLATDSVVVDRTDTSIRQNLMRRSSMTGRVTGMRRRGSMASQISQTSGATSTGSSAGTDAVAAKRRALRRNSMLSTASRESTRSRASAIDRLATEIKDLQECKEHELALAEEEKRRLRLERQQSFESAEILEDLIETTSMVDGGFDVDAALRDSRSGSISLGDISIPVDVLIGEERVADGTGKMSAVTLNLSDKPALYDEPVKGGDLDYAENKIGRVQRTRRSRSMSVDRGDTAAKRKPRRGRRLARGDIASSSGDGERRTRSHSLDAGGGYRRRHHLKRRPTNKKNMREVEMAAIANLQEQVKGRKEEIEQARDTMTMRLESAAENARMMDEIASMQVKTIEDLKCDILKTKAKLRWRQDADAIAAEWKTDPQYKRQLQEAEQSRQLRVNLRRKINEIAQEENQSNARQAELLRKIPQVRAEGIVADMKRRLEYNRIMDKVTKEEIACREASIKSRITKAVAEVKLGGTDSSELQKAFFSVRSGVQQMKETLTADIESIKTLPELTFKPTVIMQASDKNVVLAGDTKAAIERLGAEWCEQYIYLRIIRGRDEEIQRYEKYINRLTEEIVRLRRPRSQKRKDAEGAKRRDKQLLSVGGSDDSKTSPVSTR